MTDQLVREYPRAAIAPPGARTFRFFRWQLRELSPTGSWRVLAVLSLPVAWHFLHREGGTANMVFGIGVTLALAALVALATRRALFGGVVVTLMVAIVVLASTFKRQVMDMVVHAYDLYFYFTSWSTVSYLWSDHRGYMLALVGVALLAAVLGFLAFKLDGTRIDRRLAGAGFDPLDRPAHRRMDHTPRRQACHQPHGFHAGPLHRPGKRPPQRMVWPPAQRAAQPRGQRVGEAAVQARPSRSAGSRAAPRAAA